MQSRLVLSLKSETLYKVIATLVWRHQIAGETEADADGSREHMHVLMHIPASDDEKLRLFNSMLTYAGTYTLDHEKAVHPIDASWN